MTKRGLLSKKSVSISMVDNGRSGKRKDIVVDSSSRMGQVVEKGGIAGAWRLRCWTLVGEPKPCFLSNHPKAAGHNFVATLEQAEMGDFGVQMRSLFSSSHLNEGMRDDAGLDDVSSFQWRREREVPRYEDPW